MYPKKNHDPTTEFLLSYITSGMVLFSGVYTLLILYDYMQNPSTYDGLSPWSAGLIVCLFIAAYICNKYKYTHMSLSIVSATIVTISTVVGIWWGFDLPMVLLGYILSIVMMSMCTYVYINSVHLIGIVGMMYAGHLYRNTLSSPMTWHTGMFTTQDIFEISIIFACITGILIFLQRTSQKFLMRAKRTEYVLQQERDALEETVQKKISEIQKIQMEHLTHMYRFVEFGKLSSGLFHDLMSPIQTLKLHIESFPKQKPDSALDIQITHIQKISKKLETMLEAMRKQIRFNLIDEDFDILQDIHEILSITKHIQLSHHVSVQVLCDTPTYYVRSKRVILHHVLLNLISNACEACDSTKEKHTLVIRVGSCEHDQYKTYISIEDTGTGISKKDLSRIFDNFYSTKYTKHKNSSNCGIGLSSAKYAIEHHIQGRLFIESEEHVGTTATILLPNPKLQYSQS